MGKLSISQITHTMSTTGEWFGKPAAQRPAQAPFEMFYNDFGNHPAAAQPVAIVKALKSKHSGATVT